ncbi:MAG: hypothetical protein H0V89_13425, partial [Deltaproteobacteria bacterium]|nr:hypothetical protein [Deltaproteobacteria bacterium]
MTIWLVAVALAQTPVVDVLSAEIEFPSDISSEVSGARAALDGGRALEAGRRFEALAAASSSAELWRLAAIAWYEAGALPSADASIAAG